MKKFQSLIGAAVVLSFSIAAFSAEPKIEPATIGTAEMKADGTIVLRLRAELPGGGGSGGGPARLSADSSRIQKNPRTR
jgi:hypothetical protein